MILNSKISPHFRLSEFIYSKTRDASLNAYNESYFLEKSNPYVLRNIIDVAHSLETIRSFYGKPIEITSGYRSPKVNELVGGVPNSNHIGGCSVDVVYTKELYHCITSVAARNWIKLAEFIPNSAKGYIHLTFNTFFYEKDSENS